MTGAAVDPLEERLERLVASGVRVVDPRQTYVAPEVRLDRIHSGVVLYPGTRLEGSRVWLGRGAQVGREGPAVLVDTVLDETATVASGYACGAVLLVGASLGANAQVRAGTLLEEQASTAHAVGLKQTILMSFVTLGSLINFCDCLMAGGSSRKKHSEVGSGYIHFNFTPWGEHGDKATASLLGDVTRGVFLRERRIFMGGSGGLVGPAAVGYGAVAGAGQVVRLGIAENRLVVKPTPAVERTVPQDYKDRARPRAIRNVAYIGQLFALREWYRQVRMPLTPAPRRPVMQEAMVNLDGCIQERIVQLGRFLEERGVSVPSFELEQAPICPLPVEREQDDYIAWVQGLDAAQVAAGKAWLEEISARVQRPALGMVS